MNQVKIFSTTSVDHEAPLAVLERDVNQFLESENRDRLIVNVQFSTATAHRGEGSCIVYSALVWYDIPRPK